VGRQLLKTQWIFMQQGDFSALLTSVQKTASSSNSSSFHNNIPINFSVYTSHASHKAATCPLNIILLNYDIQVTVQRDKLQ